MASPFRVFRKHQKVLLATTGVLAMISFVFLAPLAGFIGGGGNGGNNPVVVQSTYGALRESDIQRLMRTRYILKRFLNEAFNLGLRAGGAPKALPIIPPGGSDSERAAVETMLLARKAEQAGFIVTDEILNNYLKQLTGGKVSSGRLRAIISGTALENRPVTINFIFEALREEFLAAKFRETYDVAVTVTPAELWDAYLKLNDRVTVELLPVPVEDFLDKVEKPTETTLREFFDKYKDVVKLPDEYSLLPGVVSRVRMDSPEPGFKRPPRAKFQFVRANYDTVLDAVANDVTDEEIKEYYEQNKDSDRDLQPAPFLDAPSDGETESSSKDTPLQRESTEPEEGAPPEPHDPAAPPADSSKPSPAEDPTKDPGQSRLDGRSLFQLAAYADPSPPSASPAETENSEQAADRKEQAQEVPSPDEANAEPAADATSPPEGEKKPTAAKTDPPAKSPIEGGTEKEAADSETPPTAKAKKEYLPLDAVSDTIRRKIARRRVADRIESLLDPIEAAMHDYSRQRISWRNEKEGLPEGAKPPEPPAFPDIQGLIAGKPGLSLEKTPFYSFFSLSETALGRSTVKSDGREFYNFAFSGSLNDFRTARLLDSDLRDEFVVWIAEQVEESQPSFAEIQDEVRRTYKMIQARDLALKKAEEQAQIARELGDSLQKYLGGENGLEVFLTEPFSWLTAGPVPEYTGPEIRITQIDGVEGVDDEFMKTVFSLSEGEIGVAMNHPKTVAYVIRLVAHESTKEALREHFLGRRGAWIQLAQQQNQRQLYDALREELESEASVQWLREPDVDSSL